MSLSVCCQWLEPRTKRNGEVIYENSIGEKNLQLGFYKKGKYDDKRISDTYHNNVDNHIALVKKLVANGIKSYRLSSNILPLFDYAGDIARNDNVLLEKFVKLGSLFKTHGIRVSTHPGQFTIISSDKDEVIQNSIKELEYHAWMFDRMGFDESPYYAINIHGGKSGNSDKLIYTINNLLSPNVKNRLTLENDERCYNPAELISVAEQTGVPIVWDSHHHVFNDGGMSMEEAASECYQTWPVKPLQHISNTEPGLENGSFTERRKHSFLIHYVPNAQRKYMEENSVDVDVEAKGKNLAVLKMARDFNLPL